MKDIGCALGADDRAAPSCPLHTRIDAALLRLEHALAVIEAINFGELLAAPPAVAGERARHSVAVNLLSLLEGELRVIVAGARAGDASLERRSSL